MASRQRSGLTRFAPTERSSTRAPDSRSNSGATFVGPVLWTGRSTRVYTRRAGPFGPAANSLRYVSRNPSEQSHEISDNVVTYAVTSDELPATPYSVVAIKGASAPPKIVPSVRLSDAPL